MHAETGLVAERCERHASTTWFQANETVARGRNANAAATITRMSHRHDARGNCRTSAAAGTPAGARQVVWVASRSPGFGFGHGQAAPLTAVGSTKWNQSGCNEACGQLRSFLWDVVQRFDGFVALRESLTGVQESEILEQRRDAVKRRVALHPVGLLCEFACMFQPHDVDRIDVRVVFVVALDRCFQQFGG